MDKPSTPLMGAIEITQEDVANGTAGAKVASAIAKLIERTTTAAGMSRSEKTCEGSDKRNCGNEVDVVSVLADEETKVGFFVLKDGKIDLAIKGVGAVTLTTDQARRLAALLYTAIDVAELELGEGMPE